MSEDIRNYLQENATPYGVELSAGQLEQFQTYMELLLEWNEKMNLTAITEPKAVAVKHFLDSILLLPYMEGGDTLIDVGTGAGFPGVPLKIMRPQLHLTLLDSLNKRLRFLKEVLGQLGLEAAVVHARAEEGGRMPNLRAQFSFVTARAVAPLNLLCEYCLPFLQMGGTFLAMKGPEPEEEIAAAKKAVYLLGCELEGVEHFTLPGGDARSLVRIRRIKPLPSIYPRHGAKIAKSPL